MKDPLQPQRCARLLAALAAPERLRIVRFLRHGPRNVTQIAEMLGASIVNVSHHLAVLRRVEILQSEKKGRFVHYSLAPGIFRPEGDSSLTEHLDLGCCRLEIPRAGK
jgi:DNA-binding transcriptional ArsR family regulator